jgi:hypothetical protein
MAGEDAPDLRDMSDAASYVTGSAGDHASNASDYAQSAFDPTDALDLGLVPGLGIATRIGVSKAAEALGMDRDEARDLGKAVGRGATAGSVAAALLIALG